MNILNESYDKIALIADKKNCIRAKFILLRGKIILNENIFITQDALREKILFIRCIRDKFLYQCATVFVTDKIIILSRMCRKKRRNEHTHI